jgi:hypothetical protein
MKKLFTIIVIASAIVSCSGQKFGADIDEKGAVPVKQMLADMGDKPEMDAKVEGKIIECCKKKGCWMTIDKGDGSSMRVSFKDYAFFVPKDADGKTAVFQGKAFLDTTSVETLRHFAEDAGKSKEEIEKINEPKVEVAFEAEGVIIK